MVSHTETAAEGAAEEMKNPALHVTPECTLFLADVPVPSPSEDELLIHVRATGVCGSDLTLWKKGGVAHYRTQHPYILGHESTGEVIGVGSNVTNFKIGDRVAIEPGINCMSRTCFACSTYRNNCCPSCKFIGVLHENGTMRRFITHPASWCHHLPATISYSTGALLEPLSVVLHAFTRIPTPLGSSVLILGAGPIGLLSALHARASGASKIVITDISPSRLASATALVPHIKPFLIKPALSSQDNAHELQKLFSPEGDMRFWPSVAVECTGVESSFVTAVYACRMQGIVLGIGLAKPEVTFPVFHMMMQEIDLRFSNKYRDTWPAAIAALETGNLNLEGLVSHKFPLEKALEALETFADPKSGALKVHIVDED